MPRLPKINSRQRGFFTFAQNSGDIDYVRMAYALAMSLKVSQTTVPYLTIGVTPGTVIPNKWAWAFDNVIEIPWGDAASKSSWKLENEWKAIHMSPYTETIKLDCDMLFFNDISLWWDMMSMEDFYICNRVVDYRSATVTSDYYRKAFTANALPNVYTAMMYFKKTAESHELFRLAADLFRDWDAMSTECLVYRDRPLAPSTDVVFALALKLLDIDQVWYTENMFPTFTHMKSGLQGWGTGTVDEDWQKHARAFVTDSLACKIGNHAQSFPLHYHLKNFITDEMISQYERKLR